MKNSNSNSLFLMKSDILNIHPTNLIHRMNDSIKQRIQYCQQLSYALEIWSWVLGIIGGCLGFLHTPMINCCNAQLQIRKRDILLSFEH